MSGNTVPFVEYRGFLKAALDFGIDVESGIKEPHRQFHRCPSDHRAPSST